jgi:hypothetical protein
MQGPVSGRDQPAASATTPVHVRIDVCKAWLDVHLHPLDASLRVRNSLPCGRRSRTGGTASASRSSSEPCGRIRSRSWCWRRPASCTARRSAISLHLGRGQVAGGADREIGLQEGKLGHRLVGAAMRRAPERGDAGGDAGTPANAAPRAAAPRSAPPSTWPPSPPPAATPTSPPARRRQAPQARPHRRHAQARRPRQHPPSRRSSLPATGPDPCLTSSIDAPPQGGRG